MDLTNPEQLKVALELAGLRARKGLGQHFLVDQDSLQAVLSAGELTADDVVVEVGPGLGVMTLPLCKKVSKVIAVELDDELAELLGRDKPDNLEVWHEDVLKLDFRKLPDSYKVVANIPYYLTSKLVQLFLEAPKPPTRMSLLIQKEVAQRITAKPGQMSVLAVSVQYYGKPELTTVVERHKFWPAPKVDSAVLQVEVYDKPLFEADRAKFFRLVKAGFGERRKMLRNSLAGGLNISIELASELVLAADLLPTARAQELDMKAWERLYKAAIKRDLLD